jgi:hypothetical protein
VDAEVQRRFCPVVAAQKKPSYNADNSRRGLLFGGLALLSAGSISRPLRALAAILKSKACDTPCVLILENGAQDRYIKVFWINYDGTRLIGSVKVDSPVFAVNTTDMIRTLSRATLTGNVGQTRS